jgi:hypothetical protein
MKKKKSLPRPKTMPDKSFEPTILWGCSEGDGGVIVVCYVAAAIAVVSK